MAAVQLDETNEIEFERDARNIVVVTGFGPFKKHNINASWEAVKLLPTTGIEKELNICLVTKEIPVSYEDVGKLIPQLWTTHNPLLVIHVGVSENASNVTFEQVAEKSGYDKLDIYGQTPANNSCCIGDCSKIRSGLNINELSKEVNSTSTSVQTCLSENAGRYLCEYIYYTSLSIDNTRSIFIHVPPLDKPYSSEQLARGLADIIRCLVNQLTAQSPVL